MTDAEALETIQRYGFHAHGSPGPNGRFLWVVATSNVGPWRGSGETLPEALEDALEQRRAELELL